MARNVDLTGKLGLAPKPTITIGETVLTVNDSAQNMLLVMQTVGDEPDAAKIMEAAKLLFDAKSTKALNSLNLNLSDYLKVIEAAMNIVTGEVEGEAETPDTTS